MAEHKGSVVWSYTNTHTHNGYFLLFYLLHSNISPSILRLCKFNNSIGQAKAL